MSDAHTNPDGSEKRNTYATESESIDGFVGRTGPVDRRKIYTQRDGSMFRIYIGGLAMIALYMSIEVPESLSASVALTSDGSMLIWAQAVLGCCAIVDAIVNDLLPARWHWRLALQQRHYIMVGMAFCFLTQIFSAVWQGRLTGLETYYTWNALSIMLAAFPDAYQRLKDAKCQTPNNS